jgi:hypothetical protein
MTQRWRAEATVRKSKTAIVMMQLMQRPLSQAQAQSWGPWAGKSWLVRTEPQHILLLLLLLLQQKQQRTSHST